MFADPRESELWHRVVALPEAERTAFLAGACGSDLALRRRLEERLRAEALTASMGEARGTLAAEACGEDDTTSKRGGAVAGRVARSRNESDTSVHGRFLPGTLVAERYRITSLAGRGGMGEVYRADDLKLGQVVALKFLPRDFARDPGRLQRFVDEVRLSRQVSHPNVCRVYDLGDVDGQHFLSMEYIDGEDLRSLLRRIGRLPQEKAVHLAQQLCAGLAAAHERGVLHRDLKPANIMVDGRGQARITDFGLARLTTAGAEGGLAGTVAYMAPEQLACGETTVQSDLYALGLVFYEMFTGRRVYETDAIAERVRTEVGDNLKHPSSWVPDLDPAVERAILRCLAQVPAERPASARAVAAALPGGDPLAAAVAAGETPSPEMVAAAGGDGMLPPRVAWTCLAGTAAGLVLVWWLAQWTHPVNQAGLEKHPEALAAQARQILQHLGCVDKPRDHAFGFAKAETNEMRFWYRQSPTPLRVLEFWTVPPLLSFGLPTESNPRFEIPGESGVRLTPTGTLLAFRAVPLPARGRALTTEEPPWAIWFPLSLTGIDLTILEPSRDQVVPPPVACDRLVVWKGANPETGEVFRVQAGAFAGRPVYFEVCNPKHFAEAVALSRPAEQSWFLPSMITSYLSLTLMLAGAALAWRNHRLGRADRRGSLRLTGATFVTALTVSVVLTNWSAWWPNDQLTLGVAQAASLSLMLGTYYMALEPYVRRVWPQLLIASKRLLDGRWSDPLVGRDLLLGSLLGVVIELITEFEVLGATWLGQSSNRLVWTMDAAALGPAGVISHLLYAWIDAVGLSLNSLLFLLLARVVFRRTLPLCGFFLVVWSPLMAVMWGSPAWSDWLAWPVVVALMLWAMFRYGVLCTTLAWLVPSYLEGFPLTADLSSWYARYGLIGIIAVAAIAGYGFVTSRGSQPLLRQSHG